MNSRHLVDFFFTSRLGLAAEAGLQLSKAVDARAKIGEDAYSKWLADLGLSQNQREEMERFFKAPYEEIARSCPCRGIDELSGLFSLLKESGIQDQVVFDPTIMRGMNYYTGTVFEIYDTSPENRRAMFGGGRYDNLIGLFGNAKLSGIGFGMGDVTFRDFLEVHHLLPDFGSFVDVFVSLPKLEMRAQAEEITRAIRSKNLRVMTPLEAGGFGVQLKSASKHGARLVVLLGDAELAQGQVLVKELASGEQSVVPVGEVPEWIARNLVAKSIEKVGGKV